MSEGPMFRPGRRLTTPTLARLAVVVGCAWSLAVVPAPVTLAASTPATLDLPKEAMKNEAFRRVLSTGKHMQIVTMHLKANEAIGMETHASNDQMVIVVNGQATFTIDGKVSRLTPHQAILIPAGAAHDVQAAGGKPAKIIVIYAPPLHPANEVQKAKPKAEAH